MLKTAILLQARSSHISRSLWISLLRFMKVTLTDHIYCWCLYFFCSSLWQLYFKIVYFVEVFYNHSFEIALFVEAFDNPYFEIVIFIKVFYNPFLGLYTSLKLFTISPWDNISHWSIIKILQYLKIIYLIEAFNTLTLR